MAKKLPTNLNNYVTRFGVDPTPYPWSRRHDNSLTGDDRDVEVYFRNLEGNLVRHVEAAPIVLGCVAWLTSEPVLHALAGRPHGCSFIIQKEDFLRPDVGQRSVYKDRLRRLYDALPCQLYPDMFQPILCEIANDCVGSRSIGTDVGPVRCVGVHNRSKAAAAPRMHNKFALFCDYSEHGFPYTRQLTEEGHYWDETVRPYAVWTGSFNFTKNATHSLENAVLIRDPAVVEAYYLEWQQIAMLSEPLDWDSEWVEPEWYIGS